MIIDQDGDGVPPSEGILRFNKYHEIRDGDKVNIDLDAVVRENLELAKDDIALINVFPNPYYGRNADATSATGSYITFSHLPARALLRIYNLNGTLVRRIEKSDPSSQFLRWNLLNEHGKPVASGIYLVTIELQNNSGADLGTRVLKVAVIHEAH